MNGSLVNILTEARDSLTPDTWRKGQYFRLENNTLCMCPHGAVQMIVNPDIKRSLEELDISEVREALADAASSAVAGASESGANNIRNNYHKSLLQIWKERPYWVKKNNGNGEIHYLLGMVGLTVNFNDHPNTTLEMIKNKFNEAIELAKIIEDQK